MCFSLRCVWYISITRNACLCNVGLICQAKRKNLRGTKIKQRKLKGKWRTEKINCVVKENHKNSLKVWNRTCFEEESWMFVKMLRDTWFLLLWPSEKRFHHKMWWLMTDDKLYTYMLVSWWWVKRVSNMLIGMMFSDGFLLRRNLAKYYFADSVRCPCILRVDF